MTYRICLHWTIPIPLGILGGFDDLLLGEHMTVTPSLNIVMCKSGLFPGFQFATYQFAVPHCANDETYFIPLYEYFNNDDINYLNLFDMAARGNSR